MNPYRDKPGRPHRRAIYQTDWQLKKRIQRLFLILFCLLLLHVFAMVTLESMSLQQAAWLTLTTITTVGYGDLSATTPAGQIATVVLMYITGITLVTLIFSDYVDYRFYRRERIRTGRWRWNMVNHILLINAPKYGGTQYYMRFVQQLRANSDYKSTPIQILTTDFSDSIPPELAELGVAHFHGSGTNLHDLSAVNVHEAKHIIILAKDSNDISSDSDTFDTLHRLSEFNLSKRCIVECVDDENRSRLAKLGAQSILRPVRTYPEIIIRALIAPGSEKVLEDLFTHENDHPHRYEVEVTEMNWSEIVCALIQSNLGTAMAYIDHENEVICNPIATSPINAKAIIVLVKTEVTATEQDIRDSIERYKTRMAQWHAMKAANSQL
ncbi:potassium channel protein [Alkalimarinus alittae]|uniref:Ion channel n=1 Tax=Alkalimarinus alittae TaxID=2961619 RepID=A0ABY6N0Y8_9ALTE|nr:ion channel [Alkalimarinus alittae]UZE95766.1 ion channel [Alkalimarinus alittae]